MGTRQRKVYPASHDGQAGHSHQRNRDCLGEELAKKNDEQFTIFCRRSISLENIQRIADALNIEAYKLLLENRKGTENDK